MPPMKSQREPTGRKGGLLVPVVLGAGALAAVAGLWWWNRRPRDKDGLPAPALLVASTAPGQPEIS